MSLCGRAPYQKGSNKKKSKDPTAAQRKRWEKLRETGCVLPHLIPGHVCRSRVTIHHLFTGGGGRKNHDHVAPICEAMHTGPDGIDGRQNYSKISWQEHFKCTEHGMLDKTLEIENSNNGEWL